MPAVCLHLQAHIPERLVGFNVFNESDRYFDADANRAYTRWIAGRAFVPALGLLQDNIERTRGDFRIGLSLSGLTALALQQHAPQALSILNLLTATGEVEFTAQTQAHSLSGLVDATEFARQIESHCAMVEQCFGQRPSLFCNTESIYSDGIGAAAADHAHRFLGVLASAPGVDPTSTYRCGVRPELTVMVRHGPLSDTLTQGFAHDRQGGPLTADGFAARVAEVEGELVNLFLDLELFGAQHWSSSGILRFLDRLPRALLDRGCYFVTPAEALDAVDGGTLLRQPIPQAGTVSRDPDTRPGTTAWLGNMMQRSAAQRVFGLAGRVRGAAASGDHAALLRDWVRLTASDHLLFMNTQVPLELSRPRLVSPYDSPYDAYINIMNIVDHLESRLPEVSDLPDATSREPRAVASRPALGPVCEEPLP